MTAAATEKKLPVSRLSIEPQNLLSIESLSVNDINAILDLAEYYVVQNRRKSQTNALLKGLVMVNMFLENSTRTRLSFEMAAKRLGADVVNLTTEGSSIKKGESFIDTLKTVNAMRPDLFVIRHVEPAGPNRVALGLDIASEPLRRHAALLAADTRTACLTAPVQLVQGSGTDRTGFLMLLPLAATPDGQVPGWVFAPLRARDLLAGLPVPRGHLQLSLTDVTDGNAEKITDVTDVWTFARDLSSRDPNWKLVATEAGQ